MKVSVRIRQKRKKSETCQKPTNLSNQFHSRMLSLFIKTTIWSLHHWILSEIFNRVLTKLGFWQSYLTLNCSFLVHFNEIITQFTSMVWTISSYFLDLDGAYSQTTLSKLWVFSYLFSPSARFLQTMTLNIQLLLMIHIVWSQNTLHFEQAIKFIC